jgi:hypothetical protein
LDPAAGEKTDGKQAGSRLRAAYLEKFYLLNQLSEQLFYGIQVLHNGSNIVFRAVAVAEQRD